MKIRDDIAELLRAGVPQIHICHRLHVAPITVQRTREALGLPAPKTCRVLPATLDKAFHRYVRPAEGDHAEWTGPFNNGCPKVTFEGTVYSAYRVAFRVATGRDPEGRALPSCGRDRCVKPGHHEDRVDRARKQRADALYTAIFGGAA